jgi:hypothetical protein
VVEDAWAGEGHKSGRSTFRADLSEMRPVLYLWGAFALRDYQLLADPNVGYDGLDDLAAFISEAIGTSPAIVPLARRPQHVRYAVSWRRIRSLDRLATT